MWPISVLAGDGRGAEYGYDVATTVFRDRTCHAAQAGSVDADTKALQALNAKIHFPQKVETAASSRSALAEKRWVLEVSNGLQIWKPYGISN